MPDSRVDRFLASTAMALLLVSSGATLATAANAASTAASDVQTDKAPPPAVSEFAPKPATDTSAKPDDTPAAADAKPASDVKPSGNTKPASAAENQPAPPVEAKPVETPAEKTADKPADAAPAPSAANPAASGPDAAITEQLRELANGKFDRLFANKKDRPQIEAFYSNRNYAPLWIADGKANARATAAIAYLRHVDADGLDPADYPLPNFKASSAPPDLADAEIILTEAVITYAHHASVGRVHWSRVSADIEYAIPAAEPGDVLALARAASTSPRHSIPTSRRPPAIARSRSSLPISAAERSTKANRRSPKGRCSRSACRTSGYRSCGSGLALPATAIPMTSRWSTR